MSADKKSGMKVASRKPVEGKKKAVKRTAPAAKAKKPARKRPPLLAPAKPKKAKAKGAASPAAKKPVTAAQAPGAPRKSFFSFLGFGNASRSRAGKLTKMTDLIKK
ncbi:MAG: hypothetical protein ABSG63_21705 [Spirochaetia bacterium]|jgi:hypothetical protein